jgi:hypothetical protein
MKPLERYNNLRKENNMKITALHDKFMEVLKDNTKESDEYGDTFYVENGLENLAWELVLVCVMEFYLGKESKQ